VNQREIRLRNALEIVIQMWLADTGGNISNPALFKEGMDAIAESKAANESPGITDDHLRQIMPNLATAKRNLYLPFLRAAMRDHEITMPLRAAAFLAQISHESAELKFMQELWGPTAQQKKYEPGTELAKTLGNTEKGDGFRYRGRGPIQITGRANYKKYGDLLGVDFVGNPDLAAQPEYAFQTAGLYWKTHNCNELADVGDFIAITKKINGGTNGLPDREKYYETAKKVLGVA
jgi:putative chitinase